MLHESLIDDAMHRALCIARRGPSPNANPQVGCVIIDATGAIVAEGWHRGAGSPHAEAAALASLPESWRARASELTAVVTLEPCNHTGLTGPCAVALREIGIGAVVYALADPGGASSQGASAGGAATLRAAGIEVGSGVRAEEAHELIRDWLARQNSAMAPSTSTQHAAAKAPTPHTEAARPHVIVKWAQTLDGRAAAADGSSQWITGAEARADVHNRRAAADAILVGTGTLLADDPSLTARAADGRLLVPAADQPIPVVLGRRPIPVTARVNTHPALAAHRLDAPIRLTGTDLSADLATLANRGVRSVFVEGGPTVTNALLAAGLADEALIYVAPALLGGPMLAVTDLGIGNMKDILRLAHASVTPLGDDWLIAAAVTPSPHDSSTATMRTPTQPNATHTSKGM